MMHELRIPAAQYLRMSTDQQQYSLENQAGAIRAYADSQGFEVVKTYSDAARSGVLFKKRPALSRLLQDVISGEAEFKVVLVYDVSRWGRFQDSDEAAHYEFACKQARIPVHYCAETFANDDSLPSSVMKALKRAMAAEYSRELGVKVFAAEKRWAELGFKQGGSAGYAMRRLMISSDGTPKHLLAKGEIKCLQSDRVLLVPGHPEEVECVREMYRLVVEEKRTPFDIARELNRKGLMHRGRRWVHQNVYRILTHPKYAGSNVWNRTSRKLGGPTVNVPKSEWVVRPGAFEPVVDARIYDEAQRVLARRTCSQSDEQVIETLRQLLAANGRLSEGIVTKSPGAPSRSVFVKRFGSLKRAFELAGYRYPCSCLATIERCQKTRKFREALIAQIKSMFPANVRIVRLGSKAGSRGLLELDYRWLVSVFVCRSFESRGGCWRIEDKHGESKNLVLLGRLNPDTGDLRDLHVLPPLGTKRQISRDDDVLKKGKQLFDLSEFCWVVRSVAAKSPELLMAKAGDPADVG